MSEPGQLQSFNEVNLNAIKNTKLFQKFMQNKSGLLANSSNASLKVNESKKQQTNRQSQNNGNKWNAKNKEPENSRQMVVSLKKQANHKSLNKEQEPNEANEENEQQLKNQRQTFQKLPKKQYSPEKQHGQYSNKYEHSYVEAYSQNINIHRRANIQRVGEEGSEQDLNDIGRNSTTNANKRKRNFNPQTISSTRQQSHEGAINNSNFNQQAQYQVPQLSKEWNNKVNTKTSHDQLTSQLAHQRENNFNYNNTFQQERKYAKVQNSPGTSNPTKNNTYSYSYNLQTTSSQRPLDYSNNPTTVQKQTLSVGYSEGEYRQKYEAMVKKYEEVRQELKTQSKNRKKQSSEWEHQIQMLKEKLFDVQSREDSLLIQNQRLREKWDSQNLLKTKCQEQNKQLTFRIKQLQDQLSMRQAVIKQRTDETNYWKAQIDTMKQELNSVKLALQKRNDEYNLLYGDYQILRKERDNKDYLLEDLRRNIAALVEENSAAKDEIFKLVTKLYQMEQENQVLKNDLKRQQFDTSQIHNFMKDLQQQTYTSTNTNRQRIQSSYVDRPNQNHYEPHIAMDRNPPHNTRINQNFAINKQPVNRPSFAQQERPAIDKPARRRGEFAKERGLLTRNQKSQRDERPLPTHNTHISEERTFKTNPPQSKPTTQVNNGNKMARIQQICEQLQKIKDLKAMNGAIRRKKIDLQRELQDLQTQ